MISTPTASTWSRRFPQLQAFLLPLFLLQAMAWLLNADAAEKPTDTTVAIIRSDSPELSEPSDPSSPLSYAHIEKMVRRATELGGLEAVVRAAEAAHSTPFWVAIKVNIVHTNAVPGDITDWRVVKAVIEAVHALTPNARISIAEGGVWIPPERKEVIALLPFVEVGDGFETAGYRQLMTDPDLHGVDLDIVDLNFDDVAEVSPPGGGLVIESYSVPRTVLDCDLFIDVPVMKITGAVGMTVAMKNLIGIAPGMVYGWSKSRGFPPGGDSPGLWHSAASLDETIVDLAGVADVDFVVVDAIVGMEKARIADAGGRAVRMNTVLAGADIVAVDAVCARVMGMNPDDMEFLTLSERRGMGVAQLSAIRIAGDSIDRVTRRFEKHPSDWGTNGEYGHYGQGVKTWLLKGPISFDDMADHPLDAARLPTPQPGLNGWGQPVYFHDDKIDLDRLFDDPIKSVTYAYTEFDAPREQDAELWVGSDEGLRVWINGELVYHFAGSRRHRLPNERVPIRIRKGGSTCLVEASQKRGGYDFSLKICEPEEDPRYDGNTVFGLTYSVPSSDGEVRELPVPAAHSRSEWWEEHTVDVTQPRQAKLGGYLPEEAQASWLGLSSPIAWGHPMELTARLMDTGGVEVFTDNVRSFHFRLVSPLIELTQPIDLRVDDLEVDPLTGEEGEIVELSAMLDSDGAIVGWRSTSGAGGVSEGGQIIGEAPRVLRRDESPPGYWDSPLGNWFCDAIRWTAGTDVAFQNNGGMRRDLEAGAVRIIDMFEINYRDELLSFSVTGVELLEILEFDVRDGRERPMQVSGVSYSFDRSRPQGKRITESSIDPHRTYTVAAEDYVCHRGEQFFGRKVNHTESGPQIVDGQIRYVRQMGGRVVPEGEGRIREVDGAR